MLHKCQKCCENLKNTKCLEMFILASKRWLNNLKHIFIPQALRSTISTSHKILLILKADLQRMLAYEEKNEQGVSFTTDYQRVIHKIRKLEIELYVIGRNTFGVTKSPRHVKRLQHYMIIHNIKEVLVNLHEKFSLVYMRIWLLHSCLLSYFLLSVCLSVSLHCFCWVLFVKFIWVYC